MPRHSLEPTLVCQNVGLSENVERIPDRELLSFAMDMTFESVVLCAERIPNLVIGLLRVAIGRQRIHTIIHGCDRPRGEH